MISLKQFEALLGPIPNVTSRISEVTIKHSRMHSLEELGLRIQNTEEHCLHIFLAQLSGRKRCWICFTKPQISPAKLEDVDLGIVKLISDSDLTRDYGVVVAIEACDDPEQEMDVSHFADSDKIADEIDTGVFHYRNSEVKDKANGILQEILEIETKHQKAKKFAELLDPFSSRKQIGKQVKLLKKLSIEELYLEVEELIP